MKKIMFNDDVGLTQAVLDEIKTKTRRSISNKLWRKWDKIKTPDSTEDDLIRFLLDNSPYKLGEVVAVAQSYKDAGVHFLPEEDDEFGCHNFPAEQTNGWANKMFTRAILMPHRIRIANVRVERLQDISYDDCLAEGVYVHDEDPMNPQAYLYTFPNSPMVYYHPREAYAALIDKISGKGTWESNPYVFVYDFELLKD